MGGLGLIVRECCSGVSAKLAFLFAVEMQAESHALLEIPNSVDHTIYWTDQFVADRGDAEGELADAVQFCQEGFGIELPWVGHFLGADVRWCHGQSV